MTTAGMTLDALADGLPAGGTAYIDADWLLGSAPARVSSALVHDPERGMRWPGGEWCRSSFYEDPDVSAWWLFDALGRVAAAAVAGMGPVVVAGHGLIAARVRCELVDAVSNGGDSIAPAAAIETSAQSLGLLAAASAVADLGTVVLAATPLTSNLAFDLYTDVHSRGLRVIGVPDPVEVVLPPACPAEFARPTPVSASGPTGVALWFALRSSATSTER